MAEFQLPPTCPCEIARAGHAVALAEVHVVRFGTFSSGRRHSRGVTHVSEIYVFSSGLPTNPCARYNF